MADAKKQDQNRIYVVEKLDAEGGVVQGDEKMIEARSANEAFRHAGVASYGVRVATTKDVIRLRDAGVEVTRAPPRVKQAPGNDPGGSGPILPATDEVAETATVKVTKTANKKK